MDDRSDDRWDDQPPDQPTDGPDGPEPDGDVVGDADLVALVREGQDEPYAELYRRHQPAAVALARTLTEHTAADDVVSEAFEKLLNRIRGGGGPAAAFRPYLLRTVRTVAVDESRRTRRVVVAEDPTGGASTPGSDNDGLVDAVHERTTLARAFAALPERWQTFLWLSFVDDADRAEIATILGINVASVSALGYRAREGLRRAYLDAHLRDAPTPECTEVWPLLASAARGGLGVAQQALVDEHLAGCDHCRAALAELEAVNTRFGAVLAPIVLGAAAPAYLAAVHQGGAVAAVAATAGAGPAAVPAMEAGSGSVHAVFGLKAVVAGLGKTSAASVAVIACVSTIAVVAVLAALTAPLGSELTVAPRPGTTSSGDGSPGSGDTDGSGSTGEGSPGSTSGVADPTSSSASDPTTSGGPTSPTSSTGGPTVGPTAVPTSGPTSAPTGNPTSNPTGGSPTSLGNPPTSPTAGPPTSGSPSSPPPEPVSVDAGLGQLNVEAHGRSSTPAHVGVPVFLKGGSADLQLTLSVKGLNKFTVTHGSSDGAWSCVAITPMAGANKTAVLRCSLGDAHPVDALRLGVDLGYSGAGSVTAVLAVVGGAVDSSSSDNTVTTKLPTKQAE